MTTIYDTLRGRLIGAGISGPAAIETFLENERSAYWNDLCRRTVEDGARRMQLAQFDQAMSRLLTEPRNASAKKDRSVGRDIVFLAIGTLLGIPTGMFSNYIYDWMFPQVAAIIEQSGVQGLSTPQEGYFFSDVAGSPRDGFINVRYAQGTDAVRYTCKVTVSKPEYFDDYRFEPGCRKIVFKFKDIANLPGGQGSHSDSLAFDISITSDTGRVWEGTQGIQVTTSK